VGYYEEIGNKVTFLWRNVPKNSTGQLKKCIRIHLKDVL
jgi:hypothetical protein